MRTPNAVIAFGSTLILLAAVPFGAGIAEAQITFKDYAELTNSAPSTSSCCPEVSVAENGRTIMMTGNDWMALSEDGGATFSNVDPTTIFPQDDNGFCCDQVVEYVPQIDMFVWLLQYQPGGNPSTNRLRLAAQTTAQVRASNGTAWTYWDFLSTFFEPAGGLDYNDMSWGDGSLWFSTSRGGRNVVRISLSEIAAKSTLHFQWADSTTAKWSHVTHNARDTVYWAHHVSNSEIRVYSMRDGDNFYSWRSVTVNSWPNGKNSSTAPDGTDWLTFENIGATGKHYVYGNALQGRSLWLGWLAAAGGGFSEPHIQMVRIDTSNWTLQQQVQVWNEEIAFLDPYLSTNAENELGMSVGFGGPRHFASHAVGVWGDFVVFYPRLSTRATSRWGDYNTSRRATSEPLQWVSGGYTNESNPNGSNRQLPHYIRFGRP